MKFKQKIIKLLKWSEKYTETDMLYLAKGGGWLGLDQMVSLISGFLLAIAFANLLSKEIYGTYNYVLSIGTILAIPTLTGINTAVIRAVAKGYDGSLIPALKTKLRWGILSSLASLGLAGYYFLNNNITLTICFLITALFVPLMNPFAIYQSFWDGKKRFDIQTKYNIIIQIFAISASITALLLFKNLIFILLAYFISHTILYFIFLQITIKKMPFNQKQDPETISYGKHLSLINIMGTIATQLDKILLWYFLGAEALAVYFFAIYPIQQIKAVIKSLRRLILPKFSQDSEEKLRTGLLKKIAKLLLITAVITIAYIILAPFLYRIFMPQYLESVPYSQLFAITIMLLSPQILLNIFLISQKKKKELYLYHSTFYIIQIVLLLILLPIYGTWGAVFALALTHFFIDFLVIYLSLKRS